MEGKEGQGQEQKQGQGNKGAKAGSWKKKDIYPKQTKITEWPDGVSDEDWKPRKSKDVYNEVYGPNWKTEPGPSKKDPDNGVKKVSWFADDMQAHIYDASFGNELFVDVYDEF